MTKQRTFGVIFTSPEIARLLAEQFPEEDLRKGRILDACCGEGALILAVVERMLAMGLAKADIASRVYGIDILPEHVDATVEALVGLLGERHRKTLAAHFLVGDILA